MLCFGVFCHFFTGHDVDLDIFYLYGSRQMKCFPENTHNFLVTPSVCRRPMRLIVRFDCSLAPGPWFNITMSSYQYRKSHCGDKTILRPSYIHHGISYTGKTTYLYWIGAQMSLMAKLPHTRWTAGPLVPSSLDNNASLFKSVDNFPSSTTISVKTDKNATHATFDAKLLPTLSDI